MDRIKQLQILTLVLLFLNPLTSFTQSDCALAPPSEVWEHAITNDFLDIAWTEVPGAVYYRVEVVDYQTQATLLLVDTEHPHLTQELSLPDELIIAVSAGGCAGEEPGSSTLFGWPPNGGIAFDDVILEREAPTDVNQTYLHCDCLNYASVSQSSSGLSTISNLHQSTSDRTRIRVTDLSNSNTYGCFTNDQAILVEQTSRSNNTVFTQPATTELSGSALNSSTAYFDAESINKTQTEVSTAGYENALVEVSRCFCRDVEGAVRNIVSTQDRPSQLRPIKTQMPLQDQAAIFPNPAREKISINLPAGGHVQILDVSGRIWWEHQQSPAALELNIANWPKGMFWIRHSGPEQSATYRFLKQ